MPSHYNISKHNDGWAIAVNGSPLMICERKKAAFRAVRDAMARSAATARSADPNRRAWPEGRALRSVERIAIGAR